MRKTILTFAILLLTTTHVLAQKTQQCHNDGPLAGNCGQSVGPLSEVGPTTSPIQPRKSNDTRFIENQGSGLDTGCTFRPDGPLAISLPIKRVVGDTNSDGTLQFPMQMVASGVLSLTATLRFPAFDVDLEGAPGVPPELDKILFNGQEIGSLSGSNETWKLNEFEIPIQLVRFGTKNTSGAPTPGNNEITILIDQGSGSDVNWCTAVDWVEISFKAVSPVILVHGNGQKGTFFEKTGFEDYLKSRFILFDHSIQLPKDAIQANGDRIDQQLPAIVERFGVDSIHLVAHSKGGLDSRSYLQIHQPSRDNQFKVLSLNTLGSPHDGTLLTDLLQARKDARDAVGRTGSINYENFPNWVDRMVGLVGFDKGLQALTTKNVAAFNAENVSALPPSLSITAVGSDADKNENGHINRQPDEYAGMRKFSFALNLTEVAPSLGEFAMDTVYQILRNTSRIKLECCREEKILFVRRKIATIRAVPSDIVIPNDILVPAASAIGAESIEPRSFRNLIYLAADGRDHGLIADARVAAQTVVWILFIEQTRGDLR